MRRLPGKSFCGPAQPCILSKPPDAMFMIWASRSVSDRRICRAIEATVLVKRLTDRASLAFWRAHGNSSC